MVVDDELLIIGDPNSLFGDDAVVVEMIGRLDDPDHIAAVVDVVAMTGVEVVALVCRAGLIEPLLDQAALEQRNRAGYMTEIDRRRPPAETAASG
jgi:hypothetical protein